VPIAEPARIRQHTGSVVARAGTTAPSKPLPPPPVYARIDWAHLVFERIVEKEHLALAPPAERHTTDVPGDEAGRVGQAIRGLCGLDGHSWAWVG
jgi:hypothetical protein